MRAAVLQALHTSGKLPEGAADEVGQTLVELLEFCGLFVRHPLVLILDQFEEFFRYQRATASFQPLIEQLTAVITNPQLPVSLVLSMREDFALELNAFKPRLPTILFENFYRLEKLGWAGAREAIVIPVEQVGFRYEPVLLEMLLNDLISRELDRLPLSPLVELLGTVEPTYLQIVCAQLWELNKAAPDKLMRLMTYEKMGKSKGILSNHLNGVLQTFTLAEKQFASKAFDHLASQRGVKMTYTAAALAETVRVNETALGKVLEKLTAVRILRSQQQGEATWYELHHDIFSSSIEHWNGAWKDQMRKRKLPQITATGVVAIVILFAGWDYYVNATNYQLRLSPKQGISNQVELWQGKQGSFDLFRQQDYIAETNFERNQLEPDKQFNQKWVADYGELQAELTGSLSIDQRVTAYTKNGDSQKALKLAKESIIPQNIELAKRALPHLMDMAVPDAARTAYDILQNSPSPAIKQEIIDNNNSSAGVVLVYDKVNMRADMLDKQEKFWVQQLATQVANKTARNQLTVLAKNNNNAINALANSPDVSEVLQAKDAIPIKDEYSRNQLTKTRQAKNVTPALMGLLKDTNIGRQAAVQPLGVLQTKDAIPALMGWLKDENKDARNSAATELGLLQVKDAIPALLDLLKDENSNVRGSAATALGRLQAKDAIPALLRLLKDKDSYVRDSTAEALTQLGKHPMMPSLFAVMSENFEASSRIASDELLDFLLHRLKNGDSEVRRSAVITALRMERGNNLNEVQKRLLLKTLLLVDQQTRDEAAKQLADEDKQESEEKARQLPINQPGLEEKPLTLDELKTKLDRFDQAYADWRKRRDAEPAATAPKATDSEADKLADPAPFTYEYAYAIANMDEAEGIKLLGHNLAKVREAAARGLANSDFLGVPLLQKLEQEWLATDNPITRQGLFHAIDIALLAMEGIGADKELDALKAYEPTLTNERSTASIKPRVEWTRIQLQWRVDALKELKELADRQLPGLLKEYCLNPDGTDMKPEECTIER
ncbi:HEAT repeat [Thiothrix caldifontis]|uniref:HEAT repeat n=1 Tax=Thiothrix caldifontis TaxID=525918 RepID=A0A1H3VL64_9GAMM|nr:HEAT repeat domain-containing protein [Thiothrix caldifontis]SDZ75543.1 HEAT repeat [Thiothrix caldifontis]